MIIFVKRGDQRGKVIYGHFMHMQTALQAHDEQVEEAEASRV